MLCINDIFRAAESSEAAVGIAGSEKAAASAEKAEQQGCGRAVIYDDPFKMTEDLRRGKIDAAVRGDAPSNESMRAVREVFCLDKVFRATFMQPLEGRLFLLGPAGIDEGWTAEDKLLFARLGAKLLRRLGIEPVVGIMSGGRNSDTGRMEIIDRSIETAAEVVRLARSENIDARDMQILIETAAQECDVIVAPDGISGNLIFRTLHFLGKGISLGAPILNLDKVYIDTSRAKEDYADSIALAAALASDKFKA